MIGAVDSVVSVFWFERSLSAGDGSGGMLDVGWPRRQGTHKFVNGLWHN